MWLADTRRHRNCASPDVFNALNASVSDIDYFYVSRRSPSSGSAANGSADAHRLLLNRVLCFPKGDIT